MHRYTTIPSPITPLFLAASDAGLTHVLFVNGRMHGLPKPGWREDAADAVLVEAAAQLTSYFAGEANDFDLPLAPDGTDFELRVWDILRTIPYGVTTSYGAIARELGDPQLARAVGTANGKNPIAVVIPCHRVVGANGKLTGYAGGLDVKARLLAHEKGRTIGAQTELPV